MPIDTLPLHVRVRIDRRDADLQRLGYRSYKQYLSSAHWLDLRRAFRESDQPQRCMCGSEEVQLHHLTYERLGAEELTDLMALCGTCHKMVHALELRGEMGLDFTGFENPMRAFLYRVENLERDRRREEEAPAPLEVRVLARRKQMWRRSRARRKAKRAASEARGSIP